MKFTDPKDKEKREELNKLYNDWKKVIASKAPIRSPKDGKYYDPIRYFNEDGLYPGYFSTKPKILFIGREARLDINEDGIPVDSIIKDDPEEWLKSRFYKRILYLIHGIKGKGKYQFENIRLELEQVLEKMKTNNKFGFAFINISKYTNNGKNPKANYKLINQFLEDSDLDKRNFIREEIELLEPDIIITANLWDGNIKEKYLQLVFPEEDMSAPLFDKEKNVCLRNFHLGGRIIKRIDTFHFSAYNKKDKENFYDPVMKLLFN